MWTEFKDENGVPVQPSGSVYVTVQYQTGTTQVDNQLAESVGNGKYWYEIRPNSEWQYGYYGAWWRSDVLGLETTQDIPNIFKIEDRRESIVKGQMTERVRSQLYMHSDMGGFSNKFPRDREILDFLQDSLNWWNSHPPGLTFHNFLGIPAPYYSIIEKGAVITGLTALGVYEAGKHFIYNDNGISLTRDRSAKYAGIFGTLMQSYITSLKSMRTTYALDNVNIRGMFSSTTGFPSLSRALRGVSNFRKTVK
ncbi:hypothetical protein LCGC14_2064570 [marine sediment metagenome]|uniref:Uncharacterized protein n=1 Tax=marine sediment metagenome TaxID=412755 RepID=A0A0F9F7K7_9ZZZZ